MPVSFSRSSCCLGIDWLRGPQSVQWSEVAISGWKLHPPEKRPAGGPQNDGLENGAPTPPKMQGRDAMA